MEQKVQLQHPAGKHAVKIDKNKYEILSKSITRCLNKTPLTHKELFGAVVADLKKKKITFEGSVEWYMESVKLDLEAKKFLQRIKENSQLKFALTTKKKAR